MQSKVYSAAVVGVEAFEVEIEVHADGYARRNRGPPERGCRCSGKHDGRSLQHVHYGDESVSRISALEPGDVRVGPLS